MRLHARRLEVVRRAVAKLGAKSRVLKERPPLTIANSAKRPQRCQMLVIDLKSAPTGRVIIFSDEKTWKADPVIKRRNDRYLSHGKEDDSVKNKTSSIRHVARLRCIKWCSDTSVLVLLWVSTNFKGIRGQVSLVIYHCCASTGWCPSKYIQSSATYPARANFLLLIEKYVPPPFSPDANPLNNAFYRILKSERAMFVSQTEHLSNGNR